MTHSKVSRFEESKTPSRLKIDKTFHACPAEEGDELYRNGIFVFNVTRLLAFVESHVQHFPVELVEVADIPYFGDEHLDEETISAANPSRPILLAEIAPGRYVVIDGNHRVAKARQQGAQSFAAQRVACPWHIPFLTSTLAYWKYVEYWNSKVIGIKASK
jgi:hypothetical protein